MTGESRREESRQWEEDSGEPRSAMELGRLEERVDSPSRELPAL
jgi:hypothetical protein